MAGKWIDPRSFAFWISKIKKKAGKIEPEITYFELVTALAFCFFAQKKIEIGVVEVGLLAVGMSDCPIGFGAVLLLENCRETEFKGRLCIGKIAAAECRLGGVVLAARISRGIRCRRRRGCSRPGRATVKHARARSPGESRAGRSLRAGVASTTAGGAGGPN